CAACTADGLARERPNFGRARSFPGTCSADCVPVGHTPLGRRTEQDGTERSTRRSAAPRDYKLLGQRSTHTLCASHFAAKARRQPGGRGTGRRFGGIGGLCAIPVNGG